jgi:phage baseplate assembly protein V
MSQHHRRLHGNDQLTPIERIKQLELQSFNYIRLGKVSAVDYSLGKVRITTGDNVTKLIPWMAFQANSNVVSWSPPTIGESALVLAEGGDLANSVALLGLYSNSFPKDNNEGTKYNKVFSDGTKIEYDLSNKKLDVEVESSGSIDLSVGNSSIIVDDAKIRLASNGSSLELNNAGVDVDGARIDLN